MTTTNLTEKHAQAMLMQWALDYKNHIVAVPNITSVFSWECDLLSMTRAHLTHELEIKRTRADYKADQKKVYKHLLLGEPPAQYTAMRMPNYFWYVTVDFDIDPPFYAGWIRIMDTGNYPAMWTKKEAPRLHRNKLPTRKIEALNRGSAYRLKNLYLKVYLENYKGKEHEKKPNI